MSLYLLEYPAFCSTSTANQLSDSPPPYQNRLGVLHGGAIASMGLHPNSPRVTPLELKSPNPLSSVDLGGSLAVASKGLFATGVSTDLNGE